MCHTHKHGNEVSQLAALFELIIISGVDKKWSCTGSDIPGADR